MKKPAERSVYIPVPQYICEGLLSRLIAGFPWLMDLSANPCPDDIDDMTDTLREELAKIVDRKGQKQAERLTALFRDRAWFGHAPDNRFKKTGRKRGMDR